MYNYNVSSNSLFYVHQVSVISVRFKLFEYSRRQFIVWCRIISIVQENVMLNDKFWMNQISKISWFEILLFANEHIIFEGIIFLLM